MAIDYSKISELGVARSVLDNKPKNPIAIMLEDKFNVIVNALRNRVDYYDADASGSMKQSISPTNVTIQGSILSIAIDANWYYKFINEGVNGTKRSWGAPTWGVQENSDGKTFSDHIAEWIRYRSIKPNDTRLVPSSYRSLNFLIRRHIREQGQEPRPFVDDVLDNKILDEFQNEITDIVGISIEVIITKKYE